MLSLKLEPVTFHYKKDLDPDRIIQFGLIAEQVGKIDPELVVRDDDDEVTTVRYEAVNVILLNEFLKEHRQVQELKATAAKQQQTIATAKGFCDAAESAAEADPIADSRSSEGKQQN